MKKIATTLLLIGLSVNVAQASWCGYNEFIGRTQEITAKGAIWNQANICGSGGGPQETVTVTSLDGSNTCQVNRSTLSANLYNIAGKICVKTDQASIDICNGAFQALQTQDVGSLKNNPAYVAIFGCKNVGEQ